MSNPIWNVLNPNPNEDASCVIAYRRGVDHGITVNGDTEYQPYAAGTPEAAMWQRGYEDGLANLTKVIHMIPEHRIIAAALGTVRYLPATFDKRFGNSMAALAKHGSHKEITDFQKEWIYRLLYKYRKQLPKLYEKYKNNEFCNKKVKE